MEKEVVPDCDDAGSYDSVTYCTVCGEETSRDTIITDPALGYTASEDDGDCSTATTCTVCDAAIDAKQHHDFSTGETCANDGCRVTAVASVARNGTASYFAALAEAIDAVKDAAVADDALIKLLRNIDLGSTEQKFTGGNVTIMDSGSGGSITGNLFGTGVTSENAVITIKGGNIVGVKAMRGTMNIESGVINSSYYVYGVQAGSNSTVNISGRSMTGDSYDFLVRS